MMSQEQKKQLVTDVLRATMKARSNTFEVFGNDPDTLKILPDILPMSMSTSHRLAFNDMPPLMAVCTKLLDKPEIEGIDVYNLVFLAQRDASIMAILTLWGRPLPPLDHRLITGDLPDEKE